MKNKIKEYFETVSNNFKLLQNQAKNIESAANLIINAIENKNKIIFCGNGGSAADSQHLSAELMGRYKDSIYFMLYKMVKNKEGKMVAAQGRALSMQSVHGNVDDNRQTQKTRELLRYITIKSSDAPDKLWFGQWRVNPKKKVYLE